MKLNKLRFGYVPYSTDLSHPGDRRRFPYFANRNIIEFEVAEDSNHYDVVLLTGQANLSKWLRYKKKHPATRFIFEMTDSVIYSSDLFRTLFKGTGRYLLGRESDLYINYKTPVKKWLQLADVVICSSEAVKESMKEFNANIVVSLDYLESEYQYLKNNFAVGKKMKLVWEGLGDVLPHLLYFKDVLKEVSSFCELHIITSEKYAAFGNVTQKNVSDLLKKFPIETIFHPWNIDTKDQLLSDCDLGIIPLNKNNHFAWHKPANKLISFWFTGLPTLVTNTPAYTKMMNDSGDPMYASTTAEWIEKIKSFYELGEGERKSLAERNHAFVKTHYSDEALDIVWWEIVKKGLKKSTK